MHFEEDGALNNTASHMSKVERVGCQLSEQAAWIHESAKALSLVVNEAEPIRSEIHDPDEIVIIHANNEKGEEYTHFPLEQCQRVYDDLVNQYDIKI
jgi:hypothetical protein